MRQKENAATGIAAQERAQTERGQRLSVCISHSSTAHLFNQLVAQAVTMAHRSTNPARRRRLIHLAQFLQRWGQG